MHGRQFMPLALPVALMLSAPGQRPNIQQVEVANQLNQAGIERYKGGQFDDALSTFAKARDIYKASRDSRGEATALSEIAMCYAGLSQSQRAVELLEEAQRKWRQAGDRDNEASTLGRKAMSIASGAFRSWHSDVISKLYLYSFLPVTGQVERRR